MLACLIDDRAKVTPAQMDKWCRDFDNWGICDTACFALFDRSPHAWTKVRQWSRRRGEYQRCAAFALLWGLTVHDKSAPDRRYLDGLARIRAAATDERRYVRMAVSMALRATGKRNPALNRAALAVARRLAESTDPSSRRTGKEALRELSSASVQRRLRTRRAKSRP